MTVQIPEETAKHEQNRLESLASTELLDSPSEERFDRITRLAQKLFGVSTATVALPSRGREREVQQLIHDLMTLYRHVLPCCPQLIPEMALNA